MTSKKSSSPACARASRIRSASRRTTPRSSKWSRPKTSASCRIPPSPNPSRACRASPRSAPTAARRRCRSAASGPDFTVTTFNGREQATTNDNRTVEFDQYPSELVTQVKIYKTPDAGMAYQGIAGTTDISTVHPLSYDSRRMSVTLSPRAERAGRQHPRSRRHRQSRQLHLHRPVPRQHARRRLRCCVQQEPVPGADERALGLRRFADRRRRRQIIGGDKSGVQSSFYERTGFLGVVEYQPDRQRCT